MVVNASYPGSRRVIRGTANEPFAPDETLDRKLLSLAEIDPPAERLALRPSPRAAYYCREG
jgi:hypothetical protein